MSEEQKPQDEGLTRKNRSLPKPTSRKPEATKQAVVAKRLQGESKREISRDLGIARETVDNILDESNVEAALAQWRRDYLKLVPAALGVVKRMFENNAEGPVDKDLFTAALQVLKGTGVHEERTRSRSDVRVSQDLTNASDEELDKSIAELLPPNPQTEN
jgi:predicted transcriptional regulator